MRCFALHKLVRDKVLAQILELGQKVDYRVLSDQEFLGALPAKLLEEVQELDPADPKAPEELADIIEATEYIAKQLGLTRKQLHAVQFDRRKKRGGFAKRIFIKTLTMEDDDPWAKYYAAAPQRFPEVVKHEE